MSEYCCECGHSEELEMSEQVEYSCAGCGAFHASPETSLMIGGIDE